MFTNGGHRVVNTYKFLERKKIREWIKGSTNYGFFNY